MPIAVGTKAPTATLKSKTPSGVVDVVIPAPGKRTVLLFFPLAFTGVCTQEMCSLTANMSAYGDLDAEVIAVSVDSPFAQEAWAQREKITVTLASDLNKTTAKNYGTLLDDLIGLGSVSARAAFVIDAEGIVRYAEQTPTPKDLPDFDAVKAALAALK